MKYLLVLLVSLSLLLGSLSAPALAAKKLTPGQIKKIENIRKRIKKLPPQERQAAVKALNIRLRNARRRVGLAKMQNKAAALEAEMWMMEKEIELLKTMDAPTKLPPKVMAPATKAKARPKAQAPKMRRKQLGISAGYIASIPGVLAEVRAHNPFELLRTSIRFGVGYAQGEDSNGTVRKHALIVLDGIYRLNPPQAQGIRSYFGAGINYDVYTTGQVSGALGGQVFYGIEGGRGRQMFFEVGYGTIRTGFSPDYSGLTALVGYKF
ncbi:hypothetical protein ACFL1W_00535 [Candidatus Margulisiibacteriota bacterium]